MRAIGTSRVLSWRWAPCVALVLGACSFAAFAALVIPDHIGGPPAPGGPAFRFDSGLASTQAADGSSRFSEADSSGNSTSTTFSSLPSNHSAARGATNLFPKRGFTPPLERPSAPPAPPPIVPQQPALEMAPQQAAVQVPPPEAQALPAAAPPDPQAEAALIDQGVRNPN